MSRSVSTSSMLAPVLVMVLGAGCGHSSKTMEAFEQSRSGVGTTNNQTPVTPGVTPPTPVQPGTPTPPPPMFTGFSCESAAAQQFDAENMAHFYISPELDKQVSDTMGQMTPGQKALQMTGIPIGNRNYRDIERSPDVDMGAAGTIRGWRYRDAGRGVNLDAGQDNRKDDMKNYATAFPAPSLRAASFDVDLERRIGEAIGDETAASKNNMLLAPCMNIIRHPYWGRTQETYSEDMYHVGRMATALTVGLQKYVAACPKHFAANNIEKGRSSQNAKMTEQTLREIYGRHFEMVVQDGGAACMMASYNLINDVKATQNKHLLRDILKAPTAQGGMGFEGLVLTDWWAMPGDQNVPDANSAQAVTNEAVIAGTDIEVPWTLHYSEQTLVNADQTLVNDAARRVLLQKFRFKSALTTDGWSITPPKTKLTENGEGGSIETYADHEALAEEAVIKSAVLVHNGAEGTPLLPLTAASNIAVVGVDQNFRQVSSSVPPICGYDPGSGQGEVGARECLFHHGLDASLGDRGSSRVNGDPARSVGVFAGIAEIAGAERTVTNGNTVEAAANADTVVVVVGLTPGDEGEEYYIAEGGDRASLDLPAGQNDFITAILDLGKPTIIVIQTGSIVNLPWLTHANQNQATVWAGYPAQRGGLALGKLIFGQANFSGKMPMAWPTEDQLQMFKETDTVTTMGYFFGYREYDRRKFVAGEEVNLVYPFGHGMSYSTFEYSNVVMPECAAVAKDAIVEIAVDVKNTSAVDGDEIVMLFVKPPAKPSGVTGERPWKELKGFTRVSVKAGETVTAKVPLRIQDLRRWEGDTTGSWVVDGGDYTILLGKDADDAEAGGTMGMLAVTGG